MTFKAKKNATITRMWMAGATYQEIADAVALSPQVIETRRRHMGLPTRNAGDFVRERKRAIPRTEAKCLCCGNAFHTENKATNRVCQGCKSTKRWRGGQDYSVAAGAF